MIFYPSYAGEGGRSVNSMLLYGISVPFFDSTVEFGDKERFGHPKIVP